MDFLNDNYIRTLPWPALSPDLNLIEHLWDEFGRRVRNGLNPPETLDELRRALIQEWNNIPQAFIRKLIGSMLRIKFAYNISNSSWGICCILVKNRNVTPNFFINIFYSTNTK
jgi:hypothetical protein